MLEKMQRLYERGETRLKPNTVTMNSVIDCWAKSGRGTLGARRAESILNRMEKLQIWGRYAQTKCTHVQFCFVGMG